MFKSTSTESDFNGYLDTGSHINGELHFEDTFRIYGKVTGSVVSKGELIVGDSGEIDGEIRVRHVLISGTVRGAVHASERIEITSEARVMADLQAPKLSIEEGALFEGRCAMKNHPEAEKARGARREDGERDKVTQLPVAKG